MKWQSPDTAPECVDVLVWGRPTNKPLLPLAMHVARYEEFEHWTSWTGSLPSDDEELEVFAWMPLPDPPQVTG